MQDTKITLKLKLGEEIRRISLNEKSIIGLQKQIKELFGLNDSSFSLKYKDEEGDLVTISSNEELIESFQSIEGNLLRIEIFPNNKEKGGRCGRFRRWREKCGESEKKSEDNHFPHPPFHHRGPFNRHMNDEEHPFHHIPFHFGRFIPHQDSQQEEFPFFEKLKEIASNLFGNQFEETEEGKKEESLFEKLLKSGKFEIEQNYHCDGCDKGIRGDRYHCTECSDFDFCSSCFESKLSSHPQHKFETFTGLEELQKAIRNGQQIDSYFEQKQVDSPSSSPSSSSSNEKKQESTVEVKQEEIIKEIQKTIEQPKIEQNIQQELVQVIEKETEISSNNKQTEEEVVEKKVIYPFEKKLEDLFTMGFSDRKKNILALVQNKGDIQSSIEYLLQN